LLAQAGYPNGFDLPMMVNTSQEAFSQGNRSGGNLVVGGGANGV
jgi:hypothetical protein